MPVREDGEWLGPDGIVISKEGNLYVAQYGAGKVFELNPKGHLIRSIPAGHQGCTNLIFGGKDERTMFITGAIGEIM